MSEPDATGKEYGWHDAAYFNMNRVLELAINNGYTNDGIKAGIDTGSLADSPASIRFWRLMTSRWNTSAI